MPLEELPRHKTLARALRLQMSLEMLSRVSRYCRLWQIHHILQGSKAQMMAPQSGTTDSKPSLECQVVDTLPVLILKSGTGIVQVTQLIMLCSLLGRTHMVTGQGLVMSALSVVNPVWVELLQIAVLFCLDSITEIGYL